MGFKSLDISNYRALRNLKVEELRRVNVLVGRNNSGKSSLLEAVGSLCLIPKYDNLIQFLMYHRQTDFTEVSPLTILTVEPSGEKREISVSGRFDRSMGETTTCSFILKNNGSSFDWVDPGAFHRTDSKDLLKVNIGKFTLMFKINSEDVSIHLTEVGPFDSKPKFFPRFDHPYRNFELQEISVRWVGTGLDYEDFSREFSWVQYAGRVEPVITASRAIDERIRDIRLMRDGTVLVDLGKEGRYPVQHIGEGAQRIMRVLSAILGLEKNGVCLIDEIDTGLHYTALPVMWKAVLQAAESNDVQVFATTHSEECVEALVEALKEKSEKEGVVLKDQYDSLYSTALYSLAQSDEGTKAYRLNAENVAAMVDTGMEYR